MLGKESVRWRGALQLRCYSQLKTEAVAIFRGKGCSCQLCVFDLNFFFCETWDALLMAHLSKAILEIAACPSALHCTFDITPQKLALYSKRHLMMGNHARAWKRTLFFRIDSDQNILWCSLFFPSILLVTVRFYSLSKDSIKVLKISLRLYS